MNENWTQWDKQEAKRITRIEAAQKLAAKRTAQDHAYIDLNNTYLAIERGTVKLNLFHSNSLRTLAGKAYDQDDPMRDWWTAEFQKLPGWNNF